MEQTRSSATLEQEPDRLSSDRPSPDTGYYARMLPPRDRPVEALGGVLNGLGAALGVAALFILPAFLGTLGVLLAGTSLAMTRSRASTRRFGIGFAIAVAGWLLGLIWATWRSKQLWP
jgi:hypothetical protein